MKPGSVVTERLSPETGATLSTSSTTREIPLLNAAIAGDDIPLEVFRDKLRQLENFRDHGTLQELLTEGDQTIEQWEPGGGERYGRFFVELLSALQSSRIMELYPDSLDHCQEYAVMGLRKSDSFSIQTEWALLRNLRYPLKASDLNTARVDPQTGTSLWLHLLHRVESSKDRNFNADDMPVLNVHTPAGPSGMAPEAIRDPKLRAEYEEAIQRNNAKIEHYNEQVELRRDEPWIVEGATKYIVAVYSFTPRKLDELRKTLYEYRISQRLQNNIFNQLGSTIQE